MVDALKMIQAVPQSTENGVRRSSLDYKTLMKSVQRHRREDAQRESRKTKDAEVITFHLLAIIVFRSLFRFARAVCKTRQMTRIAARF